MPHLTAVSLGQFVRELAIQLSPLEVLLQEWGLSHDEFEELRASTGYQHEMTVVAKELAEFGADAGYIFRMKALSEIFIKDIVNIMQDPATSTGTKVDLIKFTAEMARVKQLPSAQHQQLSNQPQGPSVVFHFGSGLPIKSMTVVPEQEMIQDVKDVVTALPRRGFDMVQSDE